jgi:hypothetical protein
MLEVMLRNLLPIPAQHRFRSVSKKIKKDGYNAALVSDVIQSKFVTRLGFQSGRISKIDNNN